MTTAATTDFCDHATLAFFKEGAQWLVTIYFVVVCCIKDFGIVFVTHIQLI